MQLNHTMLDRGGLSATLSGRTLTIELRRPEIRNAMRPSTWIALAEVGACITDEVRVVVLRGKGAAFSAGLDRRSFAGQIVDGEPPITELCTLTAEQFDAAIASFQEGFRWLRDPRFISVAAIQGYAIGAGFQLALACDIRIAADDAVFCLKEPALGLVPDLTASKHLVEAVGYARAIEWTATARNINAHEALMSGLVSRVAARDELTAATDELCSAILRHPHGAIVGSKTLLVDAADRTFDEQCGLERALQFQRFAELPEMPSAEA